MRWPTRSAWCWPAARRSPRAGDRKRHLNDLGSYIGHLVLCGTQRDLGRLLNVSRAHLAAQAGIPVQPAAGRKRALGRTTPVAGTLLARRFRPHRGAVTARSRGVCRSRASQATAGTRTARRCSTPGTSGTGCGERPECGGTTPKGRLSHPQNLKHTAFPLARHGRGCLRFAAGQHYDGFWSDDQVRRPRRRCGGPPRVSGPQATGHENATL